MHPQPLSKQVTLNRGVLWASLLRSLTNVNDKQSQRLGLQLKTVFVGHVAPYQTQAICLINISLCVISLIPLKSLTPSTTYTCGFAPSEIARKALLAVPLSSAWPFCFSMTSICHRFYDFWYFLFLEYKLPFVAMALLMTLPIQEIAMRQLLSHHLILKAPDIYFHSNKLTRK